MVQWIKSHAHYADFKQPNFQLRTAHFYIPVLVCAGETAVGITISKKIGNAVRRNLLKRRIKAWIYQNHTLFTSGYQLNLVAKRGAAELSWLDLCAQLSILCSLLHKRDMA
ncbi:MAG: ribonuclease P protein component [Candidatus Cloacimonetes bacterium]|nr:ribonuclease P protein component [Candidatus Cloacimonadota bacterium]